LKKYPCAECGELRLYRSRTRGVREFVQKVFLRAGHVYRCHNCNWRGWVKNQPAYNRNADLRRRTVFWSTFAILMCALIALRFEVIENTIWALIKILMGPLTQ